MQKPAELIGLETMTRGAIRLQGALVVLELIFHVSARAVDVPVKHLGAGLLQVGDDKARMDALLGDFDLEHHASRVRPRPGLIARRVEAGTLPPSRS